MPFTSTTIRSRRRAEVRRRDGDAPCALQITPDCQAVHGEINYNAPSPHPRSYEVDHIVSSDEAWQLGWTQMATDSLDNLQGVCRQCNRQKSNSTTPAERPGVRPTYINPRFA